MHRDALFPTLTRSWPQRISEWEPGAVYRQTFVTEPFRLTAYNGETWGKLYDLAEDPDETPNVCDSSHVGGRSLLMEVLGQEMLEEVNQSPRATALQRGVRGHLMVWLTTRLNRLLEKWPDRYDPARHYMRGPGPAFMAKVGQRAQLAPEPDA